MSKAHWSTSDDPRRFQRGLFGSLAVWIIGFFLLFTVIGVAGWQIGWWFKTADTNRQVQLDNRNTGVQTAWHDQAVQGVKDYYLTPESNTAARGALRNQTCELIGRLVDEYKTTELVEFEQKECM